MDPKGPSQPSLNQVYATEGNQVTKEPAEKAATAQNTAAAHEGKVMDQRVPGGQDGAEPTPSSLGYGVRGAPPGEERKGLTQEDVGQHNELYAAQMGASGEGDVVDAVHAKQGATGGQADLASDLDRKKAEQAPAREAIQAERKEKVDVGGVLGQRGGPANPVDKGGYPNSGS